MQRNIYEMREHAMITCLIMREMSKRSCSKRLKIYYFGYSGALCTSQHIKNETCHSLFIEHEENQGVRDKKTLCMTKQTSFNRNVLLVLCHDLKQSYKDENEPVHDVEILSSMNSRSKLRIIGYRSRLSAYY